MTKNLFRRAMRSRYMKKWKNTRLQRIEQEKEKKTQYLYPIDNKHRP